MAFLGKILIANRGEIALRLIRSARKLSIRTVAIYTESEKNADYVKLADESVSLGNGDLNSTFLSVDKIIQIAISTSSKAIHPGYGFLSENPAFAKACEEHQIIFIGPSSEVLKLMGNKPAAKSLAASLGIPVIFSQKIDLQSPDHFENQLHFPALIKASYGGGGKGMELVHNHEELKRQVEKSARAALNYFGNGELFIEQYIQNARHVEVQIIGDNYNNIIHLYERECSIQRNHQKIIEEAPAIFLSAQLRTEILEAALKIGKAVNYSGAGTVEFLVNNAGNYFFMEMNPRIQVEHAVTEEITGIDIVDEQIRIASGFPLSVSQEEVIVTRHSIELRIYAEDPSQNFVASSIPVLSANLPEHPNLRIETDINGKQQVMNQFDPLLIKVIATGKDRESAIKQLRDEINDLNIIGPETNTRYLEAILAHDDYNQNNITVEFCKDKHKSLIGNYINQLTPVHLPYLIAFSIENKYIRNDHPDVSDPWNCIGYWRITDPAILLKIDDNLVNIGLSLRNKTKSAFVLNETAYCFEIISESKGRISIQINEKIMLLSYINDHQNNLWISCENSQYRVSFPGLLKSYPETIVGSGDSSSIENGEIKSPLHGKVLEINVENNQIIKKGDLMMIIEAMKSENRILAPRDAKVKRIVVNVGAQVTDQMPLIYLEDKL
ncbi:MAG: ATP-grasp domain-containing protein [Mariniphaga sp.]|nr:ATP-grasp domain-containing protein [Mariniphaga sp.]